MNRAAIAFLALLPLAACLSQGPFPSLAPRPAELEDLSVEPVREAPVVADDAGLQAHVAARVGEARVGDMAFDRAFADAERAVARAGPQGSEGWVEAQQAISRLEAARTHTMQALADLHRISLERANLPTSAADQQMLEAAIAETEALAASQQQRIDRLRR